MGASVVATEPLVSDPILRWLAVAVLAVSWFCVAVGTVLFVTSQGWSRPEPPYGLISGGLVLPVVGLVIARHRPGHLIGWLLLVPGLMLAAALVVGEIGGRAHLATGEFATADLLANVLRTWAYAGVLIFLPLVFPTGRVLDPGWRVVGVVAVAGLVINTVGQVVSVWLIAGGAVLFVGALAAAVASVFFRYRRAEAVERAQLRWFVAAAVASLVLLGAMALWEGPVDRAVDALLMVLGPAAVGAAIVRYRLFEIDRIVSRTVTYLVVVGVMLTVYAGLVVGLRNLLAPVVPESDVAVAGSTLVVAALFGPTLRRVRSVVDRRFNRSRYDVAVEAGAFAVRLRNEVDLEAVTADLHATVTSILAPVCVSLWLRDDQP
jgi:hypothetical protein